MFWPDLVTVTPTLIRPRRSAASTMIRIAYSEDAVADLEKIDGAARRAILKAIRDKLGAAPETVSGFIPLAEGPVAGRLNPLSNQASRWVQNSTYRVVYHVHHEEQPDDSRRSNPGDCVR